MVLLPGGQDLGGLESPPEWNKLLREDLAAANWFAQAKNDSDEFKDEIIPGAMRGGISYWTSIIPGDVTYYAEGWADFPTFPQGMATDSIPGYDDLTPYGPGVVGRTIGPVRPLIPFVHLTFLDTLLSYTRQSAELGWLGKERDNDCDGDERPEDGIIRNIELRLQKARRELERGDSVKARGELQKLVGKVERIRKRSEKEEERKHGKDRKTWWRRDKDEKAMMTSEAYALLKYNTEYLLERLPEPKRHKGRD